MRRATGLIHREPQRAARIYEEHLQATAAAESPANGTRPLLAKLKAGLKAAATTFNPVAAARRRAQRKTDAATMAATLPAFPNDNSLSATYYEGLMAWLVKTGQVTASAADVPPSQYWTNSVAL